MKKILAIILLSGLISVSLFGAPKTTIDVAVYPELDKAFYTIVSNFMRDNPDIGVRLRVNGFGDHHSNLMTGPLTQGPFFDVVAVEIQFIGQLSGGGGFVNLLKLPYNAVKYKTNFVSYSWAQASTGPSNLVAMPIDIGPGCAYYRVDILEKYGINYTNIKTLYDLFQVGLKVTQKGTDGKPSQWLMADDGDIFNMILRSDSIRYFDVKGKAFLNRVRVKQAALWQKKIHDGGLSARIGTWSQEWKAALNADSDNGAIVFQPSGPWLASYLKRYFSANQSGNWRVAPLPSLQTDGVPLNMSWGGSFLAIPISSHHKTEAWKFIEYVITNQEIQMELFRKANVFPAWIPVWDNAEFNEPIPYLGNQDARKIWKDIAGKIPPVYINEKDAVAQNILAANISEVVLSNRNVDDAIKQAQKELEQQLELDRY